MEFVLLSIPTLVYFVVQQTLYGHTKSEVLKQLGLLRGTVQSYIWAIVLIVPLIGIFGLAIGIIPGSVFNASGVLIPKLSTAWAIITVLLRVFGEEILFRGLIGGILFRRMGFIWGNLIQALIFLLPHCFLLLIDMRLWPILPLQLIAAVILGWLRYKSDSVFPGTLMHAIVNFVAGLIMGNS